jgi:hypothetical protein
MALPEWLMTFLLSTLLPWVIQLMAAAIDKYLRPYATQEGIDAITGIFQKFYDDATLAGRTVVQQFIAGVIGPIFKINIVVAAPVDPVAVMKCLADVAEEVETRQLFAPYTDENTGTVITPFNPDHVL